MAKRSVEGSEVETGSGSVVAGLNLPKAEQLETKPGLARGIVRPERMRRDYPNRLGYESEAKPAGYAMLAAARRAPTARLTRRSVQ